MGYAFVGPALVLLIGVNVFPLLYSIALSFTNVDLVGGTWKFVGGLNYAVAFKFAQYGAALRTTALFVCTAVAPNWSWALPLALALKDRLPRPGGCPDRAFGADDVAAGRDRALLEAGAQRALRHPQPMPRRTGVGPTPVDYRPRPQAPVNFAG